MTTTTLAAPELPRDVPAPGLLGLAERGWLPDAALRAGIRRLCTQRLAAECAGGVEAQSARQRARLEQLRQVFGFIRLIRCLLLRSLWRRLHNMLMGLALW